MELLFIALAGAIFGLAARYALPHRHTHGVLLIPAIGVVVSAVLWEALTWAGLKWDAGVIWWITLLATAAVVGFADAVLGRVRSASDSARLERLTRTGVPA